MTRGYGVSILRAHVQTTSALLFGSKPQKVLKQTTPQVKQNSATMADMALYAQEIDLNKIKYAEVRVNAKTQAKSVGIFYGSGRLNIQFPLMSLAYNGVSKQENKDKAGNVIGYRYEMSVSFKGKEENVRVQALHSFLEKLQNKFKEDGFKNRITWFKDAFDDEPKFVAKLFHPMLVQSKDKDTGKPDGKWPDTFKIKLPFDEAKDAFTFEAHDMQKNELNFSEVWDKLKGGKANPVLQLTGLWFAGGKFGATWRLLMSKFQVSSRNAVKYRDEDDDDKGTNAVEEDDDDAGSVDIPQEVLAKHTPAPVVNPAIEDSKDEEEDSEAEEDSEVEEEEERTPSPPPREPTPPPPPAPKKTSKTTKSSTKTK